MSDLCPVRQSVILAAGFGTRLATQRGELPKPLVQVAGQALLEHAFAQAAAAGCEQVIVVAGRHESCIREHIAACSEQMEVRVVVNPRPEEPNGTSLLAAEPYVDEWFFVQMADHVFARPVLQELLRVQPGWNGHARLLVDPDPHFCDEDDATKVLAYEGVPVAIGKQIPAWNTVDAGVFLLNREVFEALRAVPNGKPSVSDGMRRLISTDRLRVVPLHDVDWVDVDTPADLDQARALLRASSTASGTDRELAG